MNEDDIPKFKIEKTNVVKRPDEELKGELTSEQVVLEIFGPDGSL